MIIKKHFNELREIDPCNITGICLGKKIKRNTVVDKWCIVFYVKQKKILHDLAEANVIPKTVTVNQRKFYTDVQVVDKIVYASCAPGAYDIYDVDPLKPYSKNRVSARPLSGGCSLGGYLNMYGTLGGLFRDTTDGTIVGLTCRHVCDRMTPIVVTGRTNEITPRFSNRTLNYLPVRFTYIPERYSAAYNINATVLYRDEYSDNFNREYAEILYDSTINDVTYTFTTLNRTLCARAANTIDMPMYQPGFPLFRTSTYQQFISGGTVPSIANYEERPLQYTIGFVKRAAPLITDERYSNVIDSAVVAIKPSETRDVMLDSGSCNFIGFNNTGGSVFATTEEINNLNNTTPVFRTGAGMGALGQNTTSCGLSVAGFYSFINIDNINYSDGIIFSTNTTQEPASASIGDSGSMLWALLSSNSPAASAWKIVGQIFANSADGLYGYACRIDHISNLLKIAPWQGDNIKYSGNPKYFNLASNANVNYTNLDASTQFNRICYAVGTSLTTLVTY